MIIKVDPWISNQHPALFNFIEAKSAWSLVFYRMSSQYNTMTDLQAWFKGQVNNPSEILKDIANHIPGDSNLDNLMTNILRWVANNITYTADDKKWKLVERWQTPEETLTSLTGDCEDGAILIAALARYKGVPSNRILIMCGSVDGGGHCWAAYRPNEYPLNWVFMDWCYWYSPNTPNVRTKYYIKDTTIYDDPKSQYYSIWFAFNDTSGYKGLMNTN